MDYRKELDWVNELRQAMRRYKAQEREEYKPTMMERIICHIKFKQLTRRNHVFQNKSL